MILPLLARNLRHHWRLLVILWGSLVALELVLVTVLAQIESTFGIQALLEQLVPAEIRELIATQIGMFSFSGGIAFGFQHPAVLASTIAFVMVVATIPTAERESGFLDLVLSRPVDRLHYCVAVLILMILGALLFPLAILLGLVVGLAVVDAAGEIPWTRYVASTTALMTLLLAAGGITLFLAAGAARRGVAAGRAAGLFLSLYWLELLAQLWEPLRPLGYLSPFHYYDPIPAAVVPFTPTENPVVLLALFLAGSVLALFRFQRQDL